MDNQEGYGDFIFIVLSVLHLHSVRLPVMVNLFCLYCIQVCTRKGYGQFMLSALREITCHGEFLLFAFKV